MMSDINTPVLVFLSGLAVFFVLVVPLATHPWTTKQKLEALAVELVETQRNCDLAYYKDCIAKLKSIEARAKALR